MEWEREQARRIEKQRIEAGKLRRQSMYGTCLLLAAVISAGYCLFHSFGIV
jgi:hypothetical protein